MLCLAPHAVSGITCYVWHHMLCLAQHWSTCFQRLYKLNIWKDFRTFANTSKTTFRTCTILDISRKSCFSCKLFPTFSKDSRLLPILPMIVRRFRKHFRKACSFVQFVSKQNFSYVFRVFPILCRPLVTCYFFVSRNTSNAWHIPLCINQTNE